MVYVVHGILLLWLVVVPCACYSRYPRHLVLGAAFLFGLLFLPMVGGESTEVTPLIVPGFSFLTLTKYKAISAAVLLAVLLHDGGRLLVQFRLSWVDLPMILWCLSPIPSVFGSPPPSDGSSQLTAAIGASISEFLMFGVPYFVGRQYFNSFEKVCDLAGLFVVAGLIYMPLCLYEVRMSPQLHIRVYGFFQHDFGQTARFGGFRPMVFMQHGLALSLFLVAALLVGIVLYRSGDMRELPGSVWRKYPKLYPALLLLLTMTTILSKSTGALALGTAGLAAMAISARWRMAWPLVVLLLVAPLYITARVSGTWTGADLVPLLEESIDEDRAGSFLFRQKNEDLLMERAFEGPVWGWGGWGRNFVLDKFGKVQTVPDGLWIIALGVRGLPGLIALFSALLLPVARYLWLQPVGLWYRPRIAPATACAVVVVLYMIDNLMNDMHNHVFLLMGGALAGLPRATDAATRPGLAQTNAQPARPLSVTDREVFRRALFLARQRRQRQQQPPR